MGYGPVLVGISLVMGVAAGSLPATPLYESLYIVAGAWEAIFFSQALAERFNLLRREKGQVQQLMLEEKTTRLEEARRHAAELEDRVLARTRELEASNAALAALSATDGLTGIANRRRFDEVLLAEWQRAGRTGQAVSLGLLDVDDFKKYNDHYGHQAGDDCLRTIASTLAASIRRSNDLVARYGGEEFAFIAPATDAAQALAMADHVRQRVEALQLPHAGSPYGIVTISVGVAPGLPAQAHTLQTLLKSADDALYRAKQQGRNRSLLAQ